MEPQTSRWLFVIMSLVLGLVLFSALNGFSQTRDKETAKEVETYNPWKVPKAVIDNTVNQVSPIEIPTETKIRQDEDRCFKTCEKEKDELLKNSYTELDRGYSWATYQKCVKECPEKVANQNKAMQGGTFDEELRYPAGSAIDQ